MSREKPRTIRLPVSGSRFVEQLLTWYEGAKRDLPWRGQSDAYRIWLAETMLQQTRIATMLPYSRRFIGLFPTVQDLARAEREQVVGAWSGLGYYRRAENLWRASRVICREHGGQFPAERKAALALPGVGVYTAGAVLSIAYGLPEAILDGNVRRVLARLLCIDEVNAEVKRNFQRLLDNLVRTPAVARRVESFNQALMELGALVCTPRSPSCKDCPFQQCCRGRQAGVQEEIPTPRKKRPTEQHRFISAIVLDERARALLARNHKGPYLQGLWEFPKVKSGPSGLYESFLSEHQLHLRPVGQLEEIRHQVTYRKLRFEPVVCELLEPHGDRPGWMWADPYRISIPTSSYVQKIWQRYCSWAATEIG